jgi:DNA helicase-2/ATP-dependent DNA helicase PcrA
VSEYERAFESLNKRQLDAVKQIEGPLLVLAGPGTGKTQLISTRVGYILKNTDVPADGILLLTFTEAGAATMRERLIKLLGRSAYEVQINTYHSFGGEIFRRYPDYFEGAGLSLIEELAADSLLRNIVAQLPYTNPLKYADNYINELEDFISEAKRALLSPDDVRQTAKANLTFIANVNRSARSHLDQLNLVSKKSVPAFKQLAIWLQNYHPAVRLRGGVLPLALYAYEDLNSALENFEATAKTITLSEWKRRWLAKDENGQVILDGQRANQRLEAAAGIYKTYQKNLSSQRLYDYDDMILRAIEALQNYPELKYSLAERYNYIMLDEFQDTNPSQFRLVELLTDHPVHEGRPNILAVGDDDQAIYAFQGAEHANMAAFVNHYKKVKIISLNQSYRAHQEILDVGHNLADQIQSSLQDEFKAVNKHLRASNSNLPEPPKISLREFKSDAAHNEWIAREIKLLIDKGIPASEIAILAPKHRYLTPLLPYLTRYRLPIRYERRENILDEPLIHQLERMSELTLALAKGNESLANAIWPEVLSYDFWQVPTDLIWRLNWQLRESHEPWTAQLLNNESYAYIADFFLKLALILPTTTFEQQLDALIGLPEISAELKLPLPSPLYNHYFSKEKSQSASQDFIRLISNLSVLRSSLRDWHRSVDEPVGLRAFVEFIEGHRAANLNILNTSPYHETAQAVNLLTAYGAKGREFRAVFIVAANDEVWGSASRNKGYRLSLPVNLNYIRYQGASEDERLRLLFVAATRARTRLYITNYSHDLAGRGYNRLKYLNIEETDAASPESRVVPPKFNKVKLDNKNSLSLEAASDYWTIRHLPPFKTELKQILAPKLAQYSLSASHLNRFIDIVNAGPDKFFMECLAGFPTAPSVTSAFGTAVHNSLRFAGNILINEGHLPSPVRLNDIFKAQLARIELTTEERERLEQRGLISLEAWLNTTAQELKQTDRFEYNCQSSVTTISARLTGKMDRLIVDEKNHHITVLDYKTGQPYKRWQSGVIKLHKFRQQLNFYKLLIESSPRFRGYEVVESIIEFVEPDEYGQINRLALNYEQKELEQTVQLIEGVWRRIQQLDFPDISNYPPSLAGIRQFEDDLRN